MHFTKYLQEQQTPTFTSYNSLTSLLSFIDVYNVSQYDKKDGQSNIGPQENKRDKQKASLLSMVSSSSLSDSIYKTASFHSLLLLEESPSSLNLTLYQYDILITSFPIDPKSLIATLYIQSNSPTRFEIVIRDNHCKNMKIYHNS